MSPWYDILEPGLALSHHPRHEPLSPDGPFQAILNVCDGGDPPYARRVGPGVRLVRRAFADCWPVPLPWLAAAVLELAELRRCGLATLVHCEAGRSRSPTVVALYWMARDDVGWSTAVERLRQIRPAVDLDPEGPSKLVSDRARGRIVACVRAYLRGDLGQLSTHRERAEAFSRDLQQRPPDPAPSCGGWNVIEDGLAIGDSPSAWDALAQLGFERVLIVESGGTAITRGEVPADVPVEAHGIPVGPTIDPAALGPAVARLGLWRREGRRVYLTGSVQDFFAVVVACVWLMRSRGWDEASAILYVGSRRDSIWRYLDILQEVGLEDLAEGCGQDVLGR